MSRRTLPVLLASSFLVALYAADERPPAARTDALGDPLPPGAVLRVGSSRLVQGGPVTRVAFSSDGKRLFSTGDDTPLRTWDVATGKELPAPAGLRGTCSCLAVSADGRLLAAAYESGIRVVDLTTNKLIREWPVGSVPCVGLGFSPDSKVLAWIDQGRHVHLHDLPGDKELRVLRPNSSPKMISVVGGFGGGAIAFTPDGKAVAANVSDGMMMLWDVETGKRIRSYCCLIENGGLVQFCAVTFPRDGSSLVTAGVDGHVRFWDRRSMDEQRVIEGTEPLTDMKLSRDGKTIACTTMQGSVNLFALDTGKAVAAFKVENEHLSALALSPDGKTLATGSATGDLRLWEIAPGKELHRAGPRETFVAAGFTRNGPALITVSKDGVSQWSVTTGKRLGDVRFTDGRATSATLAPDGKHVAVVGEDMQMRLVDAATGASKEGVKGQVQQPGLSAFSAKGDLFLFVDMQDPRTLRIWDTGTGKERLTLKHEAPMLGSMAVAFSPDGRTVLTGHPLRDRLECWELATAQRRLPLHLPASLMPQEPNTGAVMHHLWIGGAMHTMHGNVTFFRGMTFAPDGRHVAIPQGTRIGLVHVATGKVVRLFEGVERPVEMLAFSPDGRWLAACGQERVVRLWDVATGQLRATLEDHRAAVTSVAFSPDSKQLVSASNDGTAILWDVQAVLRRPIARGARPEVRPLDVLWRDLASEDAVVAQKAAREMASVPEETVSFLRRRLPPVASVDPNRVGRLIADLDSNVASVREGAAKQLDELDELAVVQLRAVPKSSSLEVQRQVTRLLEKIERPKLTGPDARSLRAVEVLELIASPVARKLIEEWAGGAAEARLTREADAARKRLAAGPRGEP